MQMSRVHQPRTGNAKQVDCPGLESKRFQRAARFPLIAAGNPAGYDVVMKFRSREIIAVVFFLALGLHWALAQATKPVQPLTTQAASAPANTAMIPVPKLEKDWYDWYGRHKAALEAAKDFEPEIVLIGDSITHLWGGDRPKDNRQNGPKAWKEIFANRRVLNLGFGWDRTQNVLWRLDQGEFDGIKPKYVVINIGTNNFSGTRNAQENTPSEVAQGIAEICKRVRAKSPESKIILMAVFPRGQKADNPFRPKIAALNLLLCQYAKSHDITFVDIGPKMLEADGTISRETMGDGVHPTEKGYAIWAESLKDLVK